MEVTPDKRQRARELADEFLGRGAGIARAAVGPLGAAGRVFLVAGFVIWLAGPAPFWDQAPHSLSSAIVLCLLLAPGIRLLRHRRRMQLVLDDLPSLVDNLSRAFRDTTGNLGDLRDQWQKADQPGRTGLLAAGTRCYRFYRHDLTPLRNGPGRVVDQVTDALTAFGGPALFLSAVAVLAGIVEIVVAPIAVIFRLFN